MVGSVALLSALPAWAIGEWFDSFRRTSVVLYHLEGASAAAYCKVTEGFDGLAACHGKWHIASGGAVLDLTTWKRNAGAAHLVDRKNARLAYSLPKVLRSNVTPPSISLSKRVFFFLPDVVLVKHDGRFGAIGYGDLHIGAQASRFIEDRTPVVDAQIVDRTWKHPNRDAGPDRRFRDNRLLPVCLYDVMHLSSTSGANELMEFSRTGVVQAFLAALHDLPHRQAPDSLSSMALLLGNPIPPTEDNQSIEELPTGKTSRWKVIAGAAAAIIVGIAVVATYALRDTYQTSTGAHEGITKSSSVLATTTVPQGQALATNPVTHKPISPPIETTLSSLPIVRVCPETSS